MKITDANNFFYKLKNFVFKNKTFLLLLLIFLIGSYFRFYNLNWDGGYPFHPDERKNIAAPAAAISIKDPNPHVFVYGNFTIYLYRFIGEGISFMTGEKSWTTDWNKINLIGRHVSALVSALSIILVYLLSKAVFNDKKIGILSAFFCAFTVLLVQLSHFATTESLLIFWLLLIYLMSLKLLDSRHIGNYQLLGIVSGIALATKTTALSFLMIPFMAQFFASVACILTFLKTLFSEKIKIFQYLIKKGNFDFWKKQYYFLVFFIVTAIFFFLASPYSILDYYSFKSSTDYEMGVASGEIPVFYTYQFIKTLPYSFYLDNLIWAQGPALKIFSLLGFIYIFYLAIVRKNRKYLLLIVWPVVYFYIIGSWHTKFIRYLSPILPILAIFAAKFLIDLRNRSKIAGNILIIASILLTFIYSAAFFSIYEKEHTRIAASKWIYDNIPAGSKILNEHWDEGLPIYLPNKTPVSYNIKTLAIYDEDNTGKVRYLAENLENGEYMIIASRRLYGTLINLPDKYPATSRYYKLFFNGDLGYNLVAEFSSYPGFLGIEFNDDKSEETFQVFDHPKVLIFKNTKKLNTEDYIKLLSQ